MARLNTAQATRNKITTHEGGKAFAHATPEQLLNRSVMSCLLWEKEFYEDGISIANRITDLAHKVSPEHLATLAIEARTKGNLRHVPLLLLDALLSHPTKFSNTANTIAQVIQRVDEMPELLSIYWRNGRKPVAAQLKKGLAQAAKKFDEYQLAKYDREGAIKLRDVFRIARPKPSTPEQSELWQRVVKRELKTPDTWEVALSSGADKKETFTRLLEEDTLGYLALLRNLRNMTIAGVEPSLIKKALLARKNGAHRVLPFRYIAAARACPQMEPALDKAMIEAMRELPFLSGTTVILVDVSGSMEDKLSGKSDLTRLDAACALAVLVKSADKRVFSFSTQVKEVPPREGMGGIDAISKSQQHGWTEMGNAIRHINHTVKHDRLIVITDEQTRGTTPDPICEHAYMINVASARNGVGYGKWTHIDGFSENVIRFIVNCEEK